MKKYAIFNLLERKLLSTTNNGKSDHRVIGNHQQLFLNHPSSAGTVFFLPRGLFLVNKIKALIRAEYSNFGFQEVETPLIYSSSLWMKSGHLQNYRNDMFMLQAGHKHLENAANDSKKDQQQQETVEEDDVSSLLGLKPMNCPAHCLIYKSTSHSYRSLPVRLADFSSLHRNELSGTLSGLTRLRQFHQDDAHIFCRQDQVRSEIEVFLEMLKRIYLDIFKFKSYSLGLSTRPHLGSLGSDSEWKVAEDTLKSVLDNHVNGPTVEDYSVNEGDGAFYGPKIDARVKDANGKEYQLATLQLDFQLPQRFDLEYTDNQGNFHRPVLIHRAILGSIERFMAVWMESIDGKWPFWCSPRQCIVIPLLKKDDKQLDQLVNKLTCKYENDPFTSRYQVDIDRSDETLSKKIRNAEVAGYHFIVVVGDEEVKTNLLAVRREGKQVKMTVDDLKQEFFNLEKTFN